MFTQDTCFEKQSQPGNANIFQRLKCGGMNEDAIIYRILSQEEITKPPN
jgi:hypothetical protein